MINQDFTFDREQITAQYFNSHSTKADLSLKNLLEDYLTFETNPKPRKNLEEIYFQAERHQKLAIAMGEYDCQHGLKPDRRLAVNEWKPMSLFLIKYPSCTFSLFLTQITY